MPGSHDDDILIEACRNNNPAGFKELYEQYKIHVYSIAVRILKNKQDAEDAAQEIFIKVFRNINTFKGASSLKTWIYRIAINLCLDKQKLVKSNDSILDFEIESAEKIDDSKVREIIEKEIQNLPSGCRSVFILHAVDGCTHEEIAEILDIAASKYCSMIQLCQ